MSRAVRVCGLGWKSLGVLELTALPSVKPEDWIPAVRETDALLVWGGSPLYLCYWMRQSGLSDLLPSLRPETVYVGTSGGAMVATPTSEERPTTRVNRSPAATKRWGSLISRCFHTLIARMAFRLALWPR
jgi:peptidase E